jgi:M6 family metalloprotease-like protein
VCVRVSTPEHSLHSSGRGSPSRTARRPMLSLGAILACLALAGRGTAEAQGLSPGWEQKGLDFHPDGAWRVKGRRVRETRARLLQQNPALLAPPGGTAAQVQGRLIMPVLTFYFQDSNTDNLFPITDYRDLLFGSPPPFGRPFTLRTYYEAMSRGAFTMTGTIVGWIGLPKAEASYTGTPGSCPDRPNGNCNGLFGGAQASLLAGLQEVLRVADDYVDFGTFDNDGPDDVPNSGDDDGYIDVVVFLQPEQDGACGGVGNNHVWSHRSAALSFSSEDPSAEGGRIKARDYIIQSAVGGADACGFTNDRMPIGTIAHELGHALDLPDLYDTDNKTEGIGNWGLMGGGPYAAPLSPARMEAWSLSEMGWVNVVPAASGTVTFGPAPTSDTTFLVKPTGANPRGEYFLLENRQAVDADTSLIRVQCERSGSPAGCGGGLLIWHVDPQQIKAGNRTNHVNSGAIHGLELIQADDRSDLESSTNRGDGGDPYPGLGANTEFSASSRPAARLNRSENDDGAAAGFSITGIRQVVPNGAMSFTADFGGGGGGGGGSVTILSEASRPPALVGHAYGDTLRAGAGTEPTVWTLTTGALPAGLALDPGGIIAGTPTAAGEFAFGVTATQGAREGSATFTVLVSAPVLPTTTLVSELLGQPGGIGPEDLYYLDLQGNQNGHFDLGDFLAWVNSTGAQAAAGASRALPAQQH